MNRRIISCILLVVITIFILGITIGGAGISEEWVKPDFQNKNLAPSFENLFGTDWMGRDMFLRTIKGLSISIIIGLIASLISVIIAVIVGAIAGIGPRWIDQIILWLIDLLLGIPHIILLILISFALGRGIRGILIGIALTHWTNLARLVRSEVLQIRREYYIQISKKLGKSNIYILRKHIIPYILPQIVIGMILMFPHAILHEASVTFLGFGLPPEQPAIGIILSESMKYLSTGMWWLAVFPGISLVIIVLLFDKLGEHLKSLIDPHSAQR